MSASITFAFHGTSQTISLPPRPEQAGEPPDSVLILGLPKAGSTLLNRIMRPICTRAGLVPFSLHNELRGKGIGPADFPSEIDELFVPKGYAYVGFRNWSPHHSMPAWADGRTVFLVRDPRDMIVSQYFSEAFSHAPPGTEADDTLAKAFEARRRVTQETSIDDFAVPTAHRVIQTYEETARALSQVSHRTWRYEDVVFDKLRWTREMVAYLGLEVPDAMITRVVEKNDVRPAAEVVTEHVRRVTPGDHKEKLAPATLAEIERILAPMMKAHGYV